MQRPVLHPGRLVPGAALAAGAIFAALAAPPAAAQLVIASADGGTTFKLGTIVQIQSESETNADGDGHAENLFFRRVRLEGAFNSGDLSVYFETDSSTLGKGNADGSKQSSNGLAFLDFVVTYGFAKELHLDGGLIRLAPTYTHNQDAKSTLALDISPYAYVESTALNTNSGRDYGVQARGYLDDHLEYRLGVFQGLRGVDDVNAFRYSGRLAWYFFGPEEGLTYRGTSLGKIQTLSIGTAFDTQKSYKNYNFDLYYDQPLHGGDGLTFELDHSWYDGHDFLPALPKQTTSLAEIGYYFHAVKLQPFFQFAQEKYAEGVTLPSEQRFQSGLAWYFQGYNSNLKLAWTRIDRDRTIPINDWVLQYQFFVF
jgi:hypothetical protein